MTPSPIPSLHYGDVYESDRYARRRIASYRRMMQPLLHPGCSILDVGAYTAELHDMLPSDVEYVGVDFDETALAQARKKGARMIECHFDRDPIEIDRTFDIVVCCETLEHLVDPHAMMRQLVSFVSPGGHLLISMPNENTLAHRAMALVGMGVDASAFQLYKHLHLPTVRQVKGFVSEYADIVEVDYYINPSGRGSRLAFLSAASLLIPDGLWDRLAHAAPGLFARGVIMLARPRVAGQP